MIEITKQSVSGFEAAIRGMRNPMNSWARSDSGMKFSGIDGDARFEVGGNDLKLMRQLVSAGTDNSKFLRFMTVSCDINAPLYWWKEFDTYRMGVEKNSCSTMHTLHKRDLTIQDFSTERMCDRYLPAFERLISSINDARRMYLETGNTEFWESMVQMLPSSYNQKRTVIGSYQAFRNMYHARKHHKLKEWREFCAWVRQLPCSEIITEVYFNDDSSTV